VLGSPAGPDDSILLPALNIEPVVSSAQPQAIAVSPAPSPPINEGTNFLSWAIWFLVVCVVAAIALAIFAATRKRKNYPTSGHG
jgi:hypothetical protein